LGPGWKAAVEATLRIPPDLRFHCRRGRAAQVGQRADVEVDHLPLAFGLELREPTDQPEAGVVDQQLDGFAIGFDVGHQPGRGI
jgi:hypothetical protein